MNKYQHVPVLLNEVLEILQPSPEQHFVDGTLGGGGYSAALLERVAPSGKVLSIDLDQVAIDNYRTNLSDDQSARAIIHHGNFRDLDEIVEKHDFRDIAGIVADLGLSSYHIDASERGISFQKKEPLDMRFDVTKDTPDARFILNNHTEAELVKLFTDYGEEKFSRQIAHAIVRRRQETFLHYTTDLVEAIQEALPKPVKHLYQDSARRIFQALRIAVNHELESLEQFLPKALDLVAPGGKIVIISFHSLEDRIVKQFFVEAATGCICPPEFPICQCGRTPRAKILTKKPITATEQELLLNMRSKPAKLRAIQKL
ncbi:MAG: 16S rRNA (cytosine(1402)-N(4))-methyltransferase RsmH [Candidatus Doudnabacteria bacterium]|nr:16S rRNA (cytosine(1402)-N(4))-methyltransferase RsmH [Candidatus Doudnabacteria bacterium]